MFWRRGKISYSQAPISKSWRRLKRNRFAMVSLIFIGFLILVSVSGYLITPDRTSLANEQHPELAVKKPGTKITFLHIRKNSHIEKTGLFTLMLKGRESLYRRVPISDYRYSKSGIIIKEYTGVDSIPGKEVFYSYQHILYPVSRHYRDSIHKDGYFLNLSGDTITFSPDQFKEDASEQVSASTYILGTDRFGRDMLSRLIIGARMSLTVGFIAVLISLIAGILIGSIAGYFRGWVDNIVIWFINIIWSLPTILLVIAITFAIGRGFWQIFIAVGLTMWVDVARIVRGQFISMREREFVDAAKVLGFRPGRIIFRHILPNLTGPLIVITSANFAAAILIEAGLSFLGIGVQPPMPSWGGMIRDHYHYLVLGEPFLAIIPGISIMLLVMAFMIMGKGLRDAFDVKIN